jgi:hypothetical protein
MRANGPCERSERLPLERYAALRTSPYESTRSTSTSSHSADYRGRATGRPFGGSRRLQRSRLPPYASMASAALDIQLRGLPRKGYGAYTTATTRASDPAALCT